MNGSRRLLALAAACLAALVVVPALSGCASPRQTEVTPAEQISEESTAGLTPLQKGAIRRDALRVAKAGVAAFLADDPDAIRSVFATQYVEYWSKVRGDNLADTRRRVRKHRLESIDVTQLNDDGTQAVVEYYFNDQSYYTDLAGKQVSQPSSGKAAEEMLQLTLVKTDEGWAIIRMIGDEQVLK